ncbi:hypothetical protein P4H71_25885 [Paenibacillus kribbensis]|uniref:hypothetical protein n=1 Tax=Paenibacillus kribbensis TaxID=172713 RepID=UPI002DB71BA1|nr:hypothetical protein [Paenibacillus kribbensis]MEC0237751.1 hypothetical protein [Paenibacillus kribbensis]
MDKEQEKQEIKQEAADPKTRRNLGTTDKVAQAAKLVSEPEQLIYIGPNLPGGRLAKSLIVRGGFPAYLEDVAEKVPEIRQLFVPVSELAASKVALAMPGSALQIAYAAVIAAVKGGI